MKKLKMDWNETVEQRLNGLNDIYEFHIKAYEISAIYKEKMNMYCDQNIKKQKFAIGDLVLLLNYRVHLFSRKLKSK